jgi:predicted lipoprotein with Yx(FWY)xxD motif
MRPLLKCLPPALLASVTLSACGSSSKSSSAPSAAPSGSQSSASLSSSEGAAVIRTASNTTLGATVLTDAHGMTLYRLSGEQDGRFICTSSSCLQVWHPVSASSASAPSGTVGSLGTVKRPDGAEQVTYKGMPLYTFASDQQPGDAKGQGLKDVGTWTAVRIGATDQRSHSTPATHSTPASQPASSSRGAYGY